MAKRNIRMTKKALATIMTVSMIMSSVNLSAFAAETENTDASNPTVTVTITEIVDQNTGDQTTTTVTEKTWGEDETAAGEGTETGNEGETGEGTETGAEGETGTGSATEGLPMESGTTETTDQTITGQETTTEVVVKDDKDRVTEESGQVSGNETIEDTKTVTNTTLEEDVLISDTDSEDTDTSFVDGKEKVDEGAWQEGTPDESDWTPAGTDEGTMTPVDSTPETSETMDAELENPLDDQDVTLDLTPGGKDSETIDADVKDVETLQKGDTGFDPAVIEALSKLETGKTITETNGNVETVYSPIYGEDGTTLIGYEKSTTTTTVAPDDVLEDTVKSDETIAGTTTIKTAPEGYTIGEVDSEGENGEAIHTVTEAIYDTDGTTIIGYKVTKTTTSKGGGTETNDSAAETTVIESAPEVTIILPTKPAEGTAVDAATGETTKITVEEVIENGQVVGYKATTIKTDKEGKELARATDTYYGTVKTVTKTTVTDPTKEVVTNDIETVVTEVTTIYGATETRNVEIDSTRDVAIKTTEVEEVKKYELIETAEGLHFFYSGQMGTVTDNGKVVEEKLAMTPDKTLYNGNNWQTATDDIQGAGDGSTNYSWYMAYSDTELANLKNTLSAGQYVLVGYGLFSEYNVDDDQGSAHATRQYVVMDHTGKLAYGYCVELNAGIEWGGENGGIYTEKDITDLTDDEIYFATGTPAVDYISSVASNGFWGTTDGLGSLEAVKDLMIRNGKADEAASLTAGQALAATQAAIWKYGHHSGKGSFSNINEVIEYYYNNDKDLTQSYDAATGGAPYDNIKALFDVLTNLAENVDNEGIAETIDADDLTGAQIILDKKAVDNQGNEKTTIVNGTEYDLYDTDIAFTLAVSTSSINGDLLVHVIQDGVVTETRRLAGDDSVSNYGKIVPVNGVYTIEGIELAEGLNITLKLDGIQHLSDGVYIYECANSQNFVGRTHKTQDIDLEVAMKFEVEEPEADVKYSKSSETREQTDIRHETKHDTRVDNRKVTTTDTDTTTVITTDTNTKVYADVTVIEVTKEDTKTEREWDSSWKKTWTYNDDIPSDDTPGGGGSGKDPSSDPNNGPGVAPLSGDYPLVELLDENVPLGNMVLGMLPATGDLSVIWMLLTLLSGLGLAGMTITEKRRKED